MDTGENKLNVEMMKEMYESYKLHQKEDYEKFVEDCKKIIQVSDRGCPDTEDVLKLVEGKAITDDHNRRLTDPSLFKLRGRQILFSSFDEPYPVMTSKDEKMMRGMSDEIRKKFQDYFEYETGIPRETITIDSIPENIREEAERESLLYGDCYILTGATKNFKMQQTYDNLEALYDILNAEGPDRNGRIWKKEALKGFMNNKIYLTLPRGHKSWLWLKLLELQKSYEINLVQTLETPPSTKVDLKSVIHMRWHKPDLSDLKPEVGKIDDLMLIDYFTNTFGPIDQMTIHSFMRHWPELVKKTPGPNLNDNKKALERVIKKGRKRK